MIVDNSAASRLGAADDVAARRLCVPFAIQAMPKAHGRLRGKRRPYASGGRRRGIWQARDEMEADGVAVWSDQLLQNLERVGTVAAATDREARGAQLFVFAGVVRHTGEAVRSFAGIGDTTGSLASEWCRGSTPRRE